MVLGLLQQLVLKKPRILIIWLQCALNVRLPCLIDTGAMSSSETVSAPWTSSDLALAPGLAVDITNAMIRLYHQIKLLQQTGWHSRRSSRCYISSSIRRSRNNKSSSIRSCRSNKSSSIRSSRSSISNRSTMSCSRMAEVNLDAHVLRSLRAGRDCIDWGGSLLNIAARHFGLH